MALATCRAVSKSKELLNQMIEEYIKSFVNDAMAGKVDKIESINVKVSNQNPQAQARRTMMITKAEGRKALSVSDNRMECTGIRK